MTVFHYFLLPSSMTSETSSQLGEFPVSDNLRFRQETAVCSYSQRQVESGTRSDPRPTIYVSAEPGKNESDTGVHPGLPVGLGEPCLKRRPDSLSLLHLCREWRSYNRDKKFEVSSSAR